MVFKSGSMPLKTRYVLTIHESFQTKYCEKLGLEGHQKYQKSKLINPKRPILFSEFGKPKIRLLVFLMPLDIKLSMVLKYLI